MARRPQGGLPPPLERDIQAAALEGTGGFSACPTPWSPQSPTPRPHGQPGLTRGLPDLLIISPNLPGSIGFIELKRDMYAKRTDAQTKFANLCGELSIPYAVTFGRDQPIRLLEDWSVVRRAAA